MKHVIIIPYFSEQEIDRYLKIADRLRNWRHQEAAYEFLLAASPRIEPSERLYAGFSQIAPCHHFQCPTKIFGYPQGPTAMFWDCMDHIHANFDLQGGFSLWMESDMVPVKPDWITRLSQEWASQATPPLLMGCYVPDVEKHRFFRKKRLWIQEHINGGACYANDFAEAMPLDAREGVFDIVVYRFAHALGRAVATPQIAFSTVNQVSRDARRSERVLLHGFLQDKDAFLDACLATPETVLQVAGADAEVPPWRDHMDAAYQKFMIRFVVRGRRAMLQALLLKQRELEHVQRAA